MQIIKILNIDNKNMIIIMVCCIWNDFSEGWNAFTFRINIVI